MYKSVAEEISQWAAQCRRWALGARTKEQRLTLQRWEWFLSEAAIEAQQDADIAYRASPHAPTRSWTQSAQVRGRYSVRNRTSRADR